MNRNVKKVQKPKAVVIDSLMNKSCSLFFADVIVDWGNLFLVMMITICFDLAYNSIESIETVEYYFLFPNNSNYTMWIYAAYIYIILFRVSILTKGKINNIHIIVFFFVSLYFIIKEE